MAGKSQEEGSSYDVASPSPSSLPPLTDPLFAFNDEYHEQVPCFSILNTNPNFPLLDQMEPPLQIPPAASDLGGYGFPASTVNGPSSYDKKMMKAVLSHLTKMENGGNDEISVKGGSPSFGEGSSDSYLSEVVWNNFS